MRAALRRPAWVLSAGTAMLILGACGDAVFPTATSSSASQAPTPVTAFAPSVAVHGLVVDSSGRPMADVSVVWVVGPEAPDDIPLSRYTHTDANGSYQLRVSDGGLQAMGGWFWIDVSRQGFKEDSKNLKIPDPSCTWDNKKCDLVVNFTLMPQ